MTDTLPLKPCPSCERHDPQDILSVTMRLCRGCNHTFSTRPAKKRKEPEPTKWRRKSY